MIDEKERIRRKEETRITVVIYVLVLIAGLVLVGHEALERYI